MKYEDLLNSHLKYGNSKEDIIKRNGYENILENVAIAPWWGHEMFASFDVKIKKINEKIYNIYGADFEFSFIELKLIGAAAILDETLGLGVTKCRNLLFIGSVGSLDYSINIGDLVIPKYSICGEGASRYLNVDLEDEFGKKEEPSKDYTNKLLKIVEKYENVKYHYVVNYTVDTIFAQFIHLASIIKYGAKTIEMETSALFKCNNILNINMTALSCVSDNAVLNKSLYSGRTDLEKEYKNMVKEKVIPNIIMELFRKDK